MQMLNKIKKFYITVFTYIIRKLKQVMAWNKGIIGGILSDLESGKYFKFALKGLGYVLLMLVQIVLGTTLIAAYIACKLTGICLII